jgi:hypothetical protein
MKKHALYQKVYNYQFSYSFSIQQVVKKSLSSLGSFISQLHFHQRLHHFLILLPISSYFESSVADAALSNNLLISHTHLKTGKYITLIHHNMQNNLEP